MHLPESPQVKEQVRVTATRSDGSTFDFEVVVRFDSEADIRYYHNDGILPMILQERSRSK